MLTDYMECANTILDGLFPVMEALTKAVRGNIHIAIKKCFFHAPRTHARLSTMIHKSFEMFHLMQAHRLCFC